MPEESAPTMRALTLANADAPFVSAAVPRPTPGPGTVLVRIRASGINPLDVKIRAGAAEHARHPLPAILGMDLAGTVAAVGHDVEGFTAGDEVYGFAGGVGGVQGSLAEYAAVDARLLARKPRGLTMREAAALPLAFITAWEGLVDRADVHAGQKVLVHGGAGGVGHVAVQLARARGADVFATGKRTQADYLRSIGAVPIDFEATDSTAYVSEHTGGHGFDVVYDTVGGRVLDDAFRSVRRYTGHVVTSLGWGTHSLAPLSFRGATYSGVFTLLPLLTGEGREHHGEIMRRAAALAEAGLLRPRMHGTAFTMDEIEDAYDVVAAGRADGKVVVDVDPEAGRP